MPGILLSCDRTVQIASRICILVVMVISLLLSSCSMEEDTLSETFRNPPQDARPQVWWHWMYGNITEEGITKDLEQMKKLGISGATQFHNT